MQIRNSRISLLVKIILVLGSLFPLYVAFHYPPYLNDDAYITLTYAKNLVLGHGFVFNHSPATLGTTTPLFALVVALSALVFSPAAIQSIAVFLTAFCWLGTVWILYAFRKDWGMEDWQMGIVGIVILGSGWISFLGMEAYLFAFLLVLSLSLFFSKRFLLTGFMTGLLLLTRGEGALVFVAILLSALFIQWRAGKLLNIQSVQIVLKLVGGFAIIVVAWSIYSYLTFGSFLPNTLIAKQAQMQSSLWRPFWQRLTSEWMPGWGKEFAIPGLAFVNLWWIVICIGLLGVIRKRRRWLIWFVWIGLYVLGYVILNVAAYWWYQLPILFVLQIFFGLGIIEVVNWSINRIKLKAVSVGVSLVLPILLIGILAKPTVNAVLTNKGDLRGESYVTLSQWFHENTQPTDSVAFIEVGYLGYYTDNRIVDLAGLTLPDIVPHISQNDFAWGFWRYQPDYYIYLPDFDWALGSIKADARFELQYQPIATLPGPRETDFVIYKRVGE